MDALASQASGTREIELRPFDDKLTPTQFKVLQGVRSGQLNKQIAYDLGIAEATVKAHMTALMRKLKVRNRTQVAVMAQRLCAAASERQANRNPVF